MTLLTVEQFDRTRRLALRVAGIELFERHREVLGRRAARLGIGDGAAFDVLLDAVESDDDAARQRLVRLVTTKFTGFFRHPLHFERAAERVMDAVQARGSARVWAAAVATGEEAYSLAISAIETLGRDDPPVAILATDIDEDALCVAREAVYDEDALRTVAPDRRERFFDEPAGAKRRVVAAVRELVTFRTANLVAPDWPVEGPVDVIFCRNVLMYLAERHRTSVLERLASTLARDGVLVLDPAEHLGGAAHLFVAKTEGIYTRRHGSAATRDAL